MERSGDGTLGATFDLLNDSTPHLVTALATRVRESVTGRTVLLVADRNLATIVRASARRWMDGRITIKSTDPRQ